MLVLDANILIRAVLGSRVLALLCKYTPQVEFVAPETAFEEARERLPEILKRRNVPEATAFTILDQLAGLMQVVASETYAPFEHLARQRIASRDENDWPVVAVALAVGCAIWTEDADFFGCGVATWTTDRVEVYLTSVAEREL